MNLVEWRNIKKEEARSELKTFLKEDPEASHPLLTEEEIEICRQEFEIENFAETVSDFTDLDLTEVYVCEETQVNEIYEFVPNKFGERMDIECEIDMEVYEEIDFMTLGKIKNLFFAEDYDVEFIEESNMAKVTFKRSGGEIKKKKVCGPGMRLKGNKCLPQTGTQKSKERKKGIVLKRAKKAMGAGAKKKATIKSKITKKRVANRPRNFSGTTN